MFGPLVSLYALIFSEAFHVPVVHGLVLCLTYGLLLTVQSPGPPHSSLLEGRGYVAARVAKGLLVATP